MPNNNNNNNIINFPALQPSAIDLVKRDWDVLEMMTEVIITDREIERNRLLQRAEELGQEMIRAAAKYGITMNNDGKITGVEYVRE